MLYCGCAMTKISFILVQFMRLCAILFLAGIVFLFNPTLTQAATVYVNSTTGNDSTGDGSSGSPYRTFHKAYTSSTVGDTLDLTGTFNWSDTAETGDASTSGYTLC